MLISLPTQPNCSTTSLLGKKRKNLIVLLFWPIPSKCFMCLVLIGLEFSFRISEYILKSSVFEINISIGRNVFNQSVPGTLLPISAYKRSDISDKVSRKVIINTECIPFVPNVLLRDLYFFFQKEVLLLIKKIK